MLAFFFFGGGCEDGSRKAVALAQAARERHATDAAGGLVFFPAGAFEVATGDALDGDDLGSASDHDSAIEHEAGRDGLVKRDGLIG